MTMKCLGPSVLVIVLSAWSAANPLPSETTTARSTTEIGDTIKQLTNQLMDINSTASDVVSLDTRTPPRIKQHVKKKVKPEHLENSHAGVAIPIDEDDIFLEETTKKLNFYKIERPTTNSGLSTWILLSGQTTSTPKPSRRPVVKPNEGQNATLMVEPNKLIKPIFKKRVSTTRKPATLKSTTPTTLTTASGTSKSTTKINKIKASILNNALGKKGQSPTPPSTKKAQNTTKAPQHSSITTRVTTATASTSSKPITTKAAAINLKNGISVANSTDSPTALPVEAKEGETELIIEDDIKKKKQAGKRKKNKNRRRRPASEKVSNGTKIEKLKTKEKPIGAQLYNYLSREVMPTVGVGLVGLMVTAGLASYFLYPFGAARRSYEVDRKDTEGSYYYSDEYSGGIAEEEAIGKVIAGMPENSVYGTSYKTPSSRTNFPNVRNRHVEHRISQGSVENVMLTTPSNFNSYQPVSHNNDVIERSRETGYTVADRKFVVGNTPKEEVTPAAVPEHGPRSLKTRWRRESSDKDDNELNSTFDSDETTTSEIVTSTTHKPTLTTSTTARPNDKTASLVRLFKEFFHFKMALGLQLIQNATKTVSEYVSHYQRRLDEQYKNFTMEDPNY